MGCDLCITIGLIFYPLFCLGLPQNILPVVSSGVLSPALHNLGRPYVAVMPRTSQPQTSDNIEYFYCSKCHHKWMASCKQSLGLAKMHVLNMNKPGKACAGAHVKSHAWKPSHRRVGGLSQSAAVTVAAPAQATPNVTGGKRPSSVLLPFIPIEEFGDAHHFSKHQRTSDSGRIDPQNLASMSSINHANHRQKQENYWGPLQMLQIMQHCRSGSDMHSSTCSNLHDNKQTFENLILSERTYTKYSTSFWTQDELTSAIKCPADVTCFGVARDEALTSFQTQMKTTQTEEKFMNFCHEHNLTYGTTRKLYQFLKEEEIDHKELKHKDYSKLHQSLKDNIPDEYNFTMVALSVGKLHGCVEPVTNELNEQVHVPVRNLWKVLCLLFADPRYQGYLDMHPQPEFQESPSGRERVYNGFGSCESKLYMHVTHCTYFE